MKAKVANKYVWFNVKLRELEYLGWQAPPIVSFVNV